MNTPITVTVPHARKLSGLGHTKIWELIRTGELQAVRVGRRRLVVFESLEKLLKPDPSNNSASLGAISDSQA